MNICILMGSRNMKQSKCFVNFIITLIPNVMFLRWCYYVYSHKTTELMIQLSSLVSVTK